MGDEELAKVLQQAEKITIKLIVNGEEIGEIDMGVPEQSHIYEDDIGWFRSTSPKVPCQPYKMGGGEEMVSYYYPYHLMLTITRRLRRDEQEALRRKEEQYESPEENQVAVPNDF